MSPAGGAGRGGTHPRPEIRRGLRRARARRPTGTGALGVLIVLALFVCALLAPVLAPYDPTAAHFGALLRPPSAAHPFGTDQLGRDVLSRVIYGARIALLVGVVTVAGAGFLGCVLGLASGYFGGWLDAAVMRVADVQLSFPLILLALTLSAVIGPGLRTVILSLAIAGWPLYVRVVRGEVLALRSREYIQAAVATGARSARVIARHLLPNVLAPIIVVSTLQVSQVIIAEATISFLGFGIQPPTPAWGTMVSEGRTYIFFAWWLSAFPGAALALVALGVNLTGDWLRDVLDPRLEP